jgi:hypothetical protein
VQVTESRMEFIVPFEVECMSYHLSNFSGISVEYVSINLCVVATV